MIDDNEGDELQTTEEQIVVDEPETGENGTGEGEQTEGQPEEQQPERKGKSVQERIDQITAEKHDLRREIDYWRGVAEGRSKPAETPQEAPQGDAKPDPAQYEFGEADPAYIEALTDWKVDQKLAKHTQEREVSEQLRTLEANYAERVTAAREEIPDYDEKVTKAAARGEWPCPPVVALGIKDSEVGPKVAYHLATNRDEAVAIANMSPIDQARAFGRLEAKFFNAPEPPQPNIATNAPEPAPARTKGGQFTASSIDDRMSSSDWFKARNAQVAAQGRR